MAAYGTVSTFSWLGPGYRRLGLGTEMRGRCAAPGEPSAAPSGGILRLAQAEEPSLSVRQAAPPVLPTNRPAASPKASARLRVQSPALESQPERGWAARRSRCDTASPSTVVASSADAADQVCSNTLCICPQSRCCWQSASTSRSTCQLSSCPQSLPNQPGLSSTSNATAWPAASKASTEPQIDTCPDGIECNSNPDPCHPHRPPSRLAVSTSRSPMEWTAAARGSAARPPPEGTPARRQDPGLRQ